MPADLKIVPETRVAHIVGTNIAFIDVNQAVRYLAENTPQPNRIQDPNAVLPPMGHAAVLMTPIGYLAKDTQVILGEVPPHVPAELVQVSEEDKAKQAEAKPN